MPPLHFLRSTLFFFFITTATSHLIRMSLQKTLKQTSLPHNLLRTLDTTTTSLSIHNFANTQYTGQIQLGFNKKAFTVLLDTGSCTLWVPDTSLLYEDYQTFDCSTSKTCIAYPASRQAIKYGKGGIEGYKISDQIQVGDFVLEDFNLILADALEDFKGDEFDGIIGLSLGTDEREFPMLLERMKSKGLIESASFSMYLGNDHYYYGGTTGEIIFGGYDPDYASGDFQFIQVKSPSQSIFWEAHLKMVSFGSEREEVRFPAIFDSGTSLILLPGTIVRALVEHASKTIEFELDQEHNLYMCNCNAQYKLEDIVFQFKDVNLSVPASSYIIQGERCFLGIQSNDKEEFAILGDVLLKNYYTLYSVENRTVGFAPAATFTRFVRYKIYFVIFVVVCILVAMIMYLKRQKKQRIQQNNFTTFRSNGVAIGGSYTELQRQARGGQDTTQSREKKEENKKRKNGEGSYFSQLKSQGIVIGSDYDKPGEQQRNAQSMRRDDRVEIANYPPCDMSDGGPETSERNR